MSYMITPAKYLVFQENANHEDEDEQQSKGVPDSLNYVNLSQFESRPNNRNDFN